MADVTYAAFCSASLGGIIQLMTQQALNFEIPDEESSSIWPWLVTLVLAVLLLASVIQALQSIPNSLQNSAQQFVRNAGFSTVQVTANGRDITVSGTVEKQPNISNLLSGIEQIEGVRKVTDALVLTDPVDDAVVQKERFVTSLKLINTASVSFEPGSSSFTQSSDAALNQLAGLMLRHPESRLRIEGHTDNTGPESVNLRLSRERAQAVADYLTSSGIASNRLIAKGYGSTQPIDDNFSDAGKARNRRIEISYLD